MLNSAIKRLLARGTPKSKEVMLLISFLRKRKDTHRLLTPPSSPIRSQ